MFFLQSTSHWSYSAVHSAVIAVMFFLRRQSRSHWSYSAVMFFFLFARSPSWGALRVVRHSWLYSLYSETGRAVVGSGSNVEGLFFARSLIEFCAQRLVFARSSIKLCAQMLVFAPAKL